MFEKTTRYNQTDYSQHGCLNPQFEQVSTRLIPHTNGDISAPHRTQDVSIVAVSVALCGLRSFFCRDVVLSIKKA